MNSEELKPTSYSKVKKIPVTRHALADLFKEKNHLIEVTDGLPRDAEVVRIDYNSDRDIYYFIVESEEFELVKEGEQIPEKDIEFTEHEKQDNIELPDNDPLDIPDPKPEPPRDPFRPEYPKFRKWYVENDRNGFDFKLETDGETLVDTTFQL